MYVCQKEISLRVNQECDAVLSTSASRVDVLFWCTLQFFIVLFSIASIDTKRCAWGRCFRVVGIDPSLIFSNNGFGNVPYSSPVIRDVADIL